jgi:hypothetical protein
MPPVKPAERARRLARVQKVMAEKGWSMALRLQMAEEFGVNPRTVDRYRREVLDAIYAQALADAEALPELSLPMERRAFVARLQALQQRTAAQERWRAVLNAMRLEADVKGLLRPELHQHVHLHGEVVATAPEPPAVVLLGDDTLPADVAAAITEEAEELAALGRALEAGLTVIDVPSEGAA